MILDAYELLYKYFPTNARLALNQVFLEKLLEKRVVVGRKKLCVQPNRVKRWLNKTSYPTFAEAMELCVCFGVRKKDLFDAIEKMTRGKRTVLAKISEKIVVDEDCAYFLGLFAGEGTKEINSQLSVTNTNEEILKFIAWFYAEKFHAENQTTAFVGVPGEKNIPAAKLLLEKLGVANEQIHLRVEPHRRKTKITLRLGAGIQRLLLECLFKELAKIISDEKLGVAFVRGLTDAEGSIIKCRSRAVFTIGMNDSYFLDAAELVLSRAGCSVRREKPGEKFPKSTKDLLIVHARDFDKLLELGVFRFREIALKRLENAASKVKERHFVKGKRLEEFLSAFYDEFGETACTTADIGRKLGRTQGHVDHLAKLAEDKRLLIRRRIKPNQPHICELSEAGIKFVKAVKDEKQNKMNALVERVSNYELHTNNFREA